MKNEDGKNRCKKTETWNGHAIRFVEKDGQWWAVAQDVCAALDIDDAGQAVAQAEERLKSAGVCDPFSKRVTLPIDPTKPKSRKTQKFLCVNEAGLNLLIMRSRKKEAVAFQYWIASAVLPALRKSAGLSEYETFRMMDKEHQKEAMRRLNEKLHDPVKVDYIKANTIADKAVSTKYGFPKMIKKEAMTEDMLRAREPVLDDVVNLMALNERLNLGLSISEAIYGGYGGRG